MLKSMEEVYPMNSKYDVILLDKKPILFSNARIRRNTLLEGLYAYDIQHSDDGFESCAIKETIMVNHYATIITAFPLEVDEWGWRFLEDNDLDESYTGKYQTMDEYLYEYTHAIYEVVHLDKRLALFTFEDIDRNTVPNNLYSYEILSSSSKTPIAICKTLSERRLGILIVDKPIELDQSGWRILNANDLIFSENYKNITIEDFMKIIKPSMTQEML